MQREVLEAVPMKIKSLLAACAITAGTLLAPAVAQAQSSSCYGYCGTYAGSCWCDQYCSTYGDCCSDYQQACNAGFTSCFVVVHGWDYNRAIYDEASAKASWDSSAQTSFARDGVKVRYAHYDGADKYYWDSAAIVAQQIVDVGNSADCIGKPLSVVAYSMGGLVMDEILAQADSSDPYYKPIYATAKNRITEVWTIDAVHGGAELADKYEFVNDLLFGFGNAITGFGNAIRGLMTSMSPRAFGYNDVDRPVYAIGGYDGWWYTDPPGEDDGVLAYHSQYGIRYAGSYWGDWRGNVPNDHWASNGWFYNAWQADKDHFEAKGGANHRIAKLKTSPVTGYCSCENDTWYSSHNNPSLVRTYGF
jgi:hypothetical protein